MDHVGYIIAGLRLAEVRGARELEIGQIPVTLASLAQKDRAAGAPVVRFAWRHLEGKPDHGIRG